MFQRTIRIWTCVAAATVAAIVTAAPAAAQTYTPEKPRRHFISVSVDWLYSHPLHFAEHPLEDLVGTQVASAQFEAYDYRTRDGAILIDVVEFKRRTRGAGVTVYPFGSSVGPTLALRASYEELPDIQLAFQGDGAPEAYSLTGARSTDFGAAIHVADRSAGWGLGSFAFVGGGIGRITSDLGDGGRSFAEAGGGLTAGPLGVELSVKFAWNRLELPVEHRFLTIPIAVRGTVTF